MGITNGTTKVLNLALELLALVSKQHGAASAILAHADEIQRQDEANDPLLRKVIGDLTELKHTRRAA